MRGKVSKLEELKNRVSTEWKHIPSLQGKKALRNLFILRQLAIAKSSGLSAWDLALEYLRQTNPNFPFWTEDTVYHERQKENAAMNRRLKFLMEKHYLVKVNSIYMLSPKGFFLIMAVDPSIITLIPNQRFNQVLAEINIDKPNFIEDGNLTEEEIASITSSFQDQFKNENLSIVIARLIKKWKINMDEIDNEEFVKFLLTQVSNQLRKC